MGSGYMRYVWGQDISDMYGVRIYEVCMGSGYKRYVWGQDIRDMYGVRI